MEGNMAPGPDKSPTLSMIMPCYNEEDILGYTIPKLVDEFTKSNHPLELIVVDNGSSDRTGTIIQEFAEKYPAIVHHRVDLNEGYGKGVLSGAKVATGPWIGIIPADGQVDAEDVVRLYEAVLSTDGNIVGKVRRRFRMDGLVRKFVSSGFNLFVRLLWPQLESIDVNGSPKMLPAKLFELMELQSKNWLLDMELMIKAHYMGVHVLEFNVFARMRGNGLSHVRAATCWEFFRHLLIFRFSPSMNRWKNIVFADHLSRDRVDNAS